MESAAALGMVGVAAAISNTDNECILRRELQNKQRRWDARRTGGGTELVFEFLQQFELTDQRQVQSIFSQTSSVPPPFHTPYASLDSLSQHTSQVAGF